MPTSPPSGHPPGPPPLLPVDREDLERGIGTWDVDDDLLAATVADGVPRVRLLRPGGRFVVLGRGSRTDREVWLPACRAAGVPVLRRRGGGCAVVLDPGNLILSVVEPVEGIGGNDRHFERLTARVLAALAAAGAPGVGREGTSDLAFEDRKVGGSAIWRTRGLLYYSTTILLDPDVDLMERLLPHPPREPAWRRGRRHRDFVGQLGRGVDGVTLERRVRESGTGGT